MIGKDERCEETVSQSGKGKRPAVKGVKPIDRSTPKPSKLGSLQVNCWKIAVGQGVKVPSPQYNVPGSSLPSVKVKYCKFAVGQGLKLPSPH